MNNEAIYLRLTDRDHKGKIVKQLGTKYYRYDNGDWKRCGISIGYYLPEAPEYECYEIITEKEAFKSLNISTK